MKIPPQSLCSRLVRKVISLTNAKSKHKKDNKNGALRLVFVFDLLLAKHYHPRMVCIPLRASIVLVLLFFHATLPAADTFRIATYNVENYLDQPGGSRPAKSDAAKAKVREGILLITCKGEI